MLIETSILFCSCTSVYSYVIQPKLTNSLRSSSFLPEEFENRGIEDNDNGQPDGRQTFRRRKMGITRNAYTRPSAFGRYAYRSGYGSNRGATDYEITGRPAPFYGSHQNPRINNIYGAAPYLSTNDLISSFENRPIYNLDNLRFIPDRYVEQARYEKSRGYPEAIYQRLMSYFNRYGHNFQSRDRSLWQLGASNAAGEPYDDETSLVISDSATGTKERRELIF